MQLGALQKTIASGNSQLTQSMRNQSPRLYTSEMPDPDLIIRTSERSVYPISCCGRWLTLNCISQMFSGLIFQEKNCSKPS